jgi:hypothetical protein
MTSWAPAARTEPDPVDGGQLLVEASVYSESVVKVPRLKRADESGLAAACRAAVNNVYVTMLKGPPRWRR